MHSSDPRSLASVPSSAARLLVSVALGLGWGTYATRYVTARQWQGGDFTATWLAARAILRGMEPYHTVLAWERAYGYANQLGWYYPMPAVLAGIPFVALSPELAGGAFFGLSVGGAAWVLTKRGWPPVCALLGPACLRAAQNCQWSPLLLLALMGAPCLRGLTILKPSSGAAVFLARPTRAGALVAALLLAAATALEPRWPVYWWTTASHSAFARAPITVAWVGPILLLAALRWRAWEGRLVLGLALFPHTLFWTDELVLGSVARTGAEARWITLLGWFGYHVWMAWQFGTHPGAVRLYEGTPWVIAVLYLPCLVVVLRRPQGGDLPGWLVRLTRSRRSASSAE